MAGQVVEDDDIANGREIVLRRVAKPILLSGYLAPITRKYERNITLNWRRTARFSVSR